MERMRLGHLMMLWHGGQDDPIYAVASFYVDDDTYPKRSVAKDALYNLRRDLAEFEKMAKGEPVMVWRNGRQVDLAKFAGYTVAKCERRAKQLRRITRALRRYIREDYKPGTVVDVQA